MNFILVCSMFTTYKYGKYMGGCSVGKILRLFGGIHL